MDAVDAGPAVDALDPRTRDQLAAISEVLQLAQALNVAIWLRGGWAVDFCLGRVTRRHEDVDWFAWDDDLPRLVELLLGAGWVDVGAHPREQQRDLRRGAVELGFAALARGSDGSVLVGGGPYAGAAWPSGMLQHAVVGALHGVRCPVISPAAQLEIKRLMPVWVPGRPRRPKDADDIALLRAAGHRDDPLVP